MQRSVAVLAATVVSIAGCIDILASDAPGDVRDAVLDHFQALIDADVDGFLSHYSDDWVDLGGGDGTPYTKEKHRRSMQEYFASDEYRQGFAGIKTPGDAVRLETFRTWTYDEFTTDPELRDWADGYEAEEHDVHVWIDDREGDPWLDGGWGGFYRPAGGSWVAVAGD